MVVLVGLYYPVPGIRLNRLKQECFGELVNEFVHPLNWIGVAYFYVDEFCVIDEKYEGAILLL